MGREPGLDGIGRWDLLLPLVVAVVSAVELVGLAEGRTAVAATSFPACSLLVLRRKTPLLAGGGALLLVAVQPLLGVPSNETTALLGAIFLAGYAMGRHAAVVPGLGVLAVTASVVLLAGPDSSPAGPALGDVLFVGSVLLLPWTAGRLVRAQVGRTDDADRRAQALLAERDEATRMAVEAERRRIAAELHDVIAHSLSVMVVQAQAAQDLVRPDPDAAVLAIGHVQDAGRRALRETGTLLHLIRSDETATAPPPGTADLPRLVEEFARSGLDVHLDTDEPGRALPAGVDVSVYRIVEEALTNAVRHATGAATVHVRRTPTAVEVRVASHGVRDEPLTPSAGLGLTGMRERVQVFGGSFDAGPAGDGFVVRATLPLAGPA